MLLTIDTPHAAAGNWLSSAWKKARDSVQKIITPEEQAGSSDDQQQTEEQLAASTEYDDHQRDYGDDPAAFQEEEETNYASPPAHDTDYEPFDGELGAWGVQA